MAESKIPNIPCLRPSLQESFRVLEPFQRSLLDLLESVVSAFCPWSSLSRARSMSPRSVFCMSDQEPVAGAGVHLESTGWLKVDVGSQKVAHREEQLLQDQAFGHITP